MKSNRTDTYGIAIPDSRKAEIQILADLISNPGYISMARDRIEKDMFSSESNSAAWSLLLDMDMKRETIDLTTVGTKIDKSIVRDIIKPEYNFGVCTEMTVISHCTALAQASYRRKVYLGALALMQESQKPEARHEGLMLSVESFVTGLSGDIPRERATKSISEVLCSLENNLEKIQNTRLSGRKVRIPTGIPSLDYLTYSGFAPGNLVILAARPSVGKTALMLHMAKSAAEAGFPATVYSLEMANEELAQRLLFSTGLLSPKGLATGDFKWDEVESACRIYADIPLYFNDKSRTVDDIVSDIISGHGAGRCSIAFIDYLGLMRSLEAKQSLNQVIAGITSRLKQTAMECRIPIVLLCQMNRDIEKGNRPPQLRDLRDSGSIEQDADIVLMLERESRTTDGQDINVWVRKNRQGQAGDVVFGLRSNKTFSDFSEIKNEYQEDATMAFPD